MNDGTSQHVLIIGTVWPEPDSSAAGRRMMQLMNLFRSKGWKITFATTASESSHRADLAKIDIETAGIEINSDQFDCWIRSIQPTIVLFDRFMTEEQFGWRVAEQCPEAVRILDTEDLHCLRKARGKAFKSGLPFYEEDLLVDDLAKRELAAIYRCDHSLIISEYEMSILRQLFGVPANLLMYVPYLLDKIEGETVRDWPGFEARKHFITIGNFLHEPNWHAIQYLKKELWPLIRAKLPEAEMHIYGAYASQKVNDLHCPDEGFHIKGRAVDSKEVVKNARVCLAPLRFGAGLKGKLIEAMQCGTPNITTDIGAEGIAGKLEWSGRIANRTDEFVAAALELYNDREKWYRCQKNGIQIINSRFRKDRFGPELIRRILDIQEQLDKHRQKNFIGTLLMHHTMASTKYMSKWIEAKNRG
ncbi:MAG: glycosyltransferase family 4 protein [Balneolaceae bacterium]